MSFDAFVETLAMAHWLVRKEVLQNINSYPLLFTSCIYNFAHLRWRHVLYLARVNPSLWQGCNCGSQLTAQLRLTATFAMAGQPQPLAGLQSMRMDYSCFHFLWARTMAIFGHARVSQELRCRLPSETPQVIDCDPAAMARPFGAKADDDAGDYVVS